MNHNLLIGLTAIIVLGTLAQWISWKFKLPSILLLLIFGFIAGPFTGFINPDQYFGKLLFPIVSISVAVILFEGGLSLKFSELKAVGGTIRNLIIIGIPITWILSTAGSYFLLDLSFPMSLLFGAILIVTGPTVVLPLLRQIRPTTQVNTVLKWEGIINDPIGALVAILIFEGILAGGFQAATTHALIGFFKTLIITTSIGFLAGYLIMLLLKHRLIPDFLQNPFSLTMVVAIFMISNLVQAESGLFAVTIAGIFLANQKKVTVKHIVEFKENLRILLISVLFIMLAARLRLSDIEMLSISSFVFVALLILLIRPIAVLLSTIKSSLNLKERFYVSWMAPRGIVAAAVSSLFAIELVNKGVAHAEKLVPLTFLVIIVTITIYGLSAMPLAKWLGIANPNPQGCLILGANNFGRSIGKILQSKGFKILLIDTNRFNISTARMENLPTYYGSVLSEQIINEIDLNGIGKLLAITPNMEVNSLAALYFSKVFGASEVYQLLINNQPVKDGKELSKELKGQILFNPKFDISYLVANYDENIKIKSTNITEKFDYNSFLNQNRNEIIIPLFLVDEDKNLKVFTSENQPEPKMGEMLISLFNNNSSS